MSKEIVLTLKNGEVFKGDEYRYNHFSNRYELLNDNTSIEIDISEIKAITKGKISKGSHDDWKGF